VASRYLIGDICGTNSTLAIVDIDKKVKFVKKESFQTNDFNSLSEILEKFLEGDSNNFNVGVFSVAGRVNGDDIKLTNNLLLIDSNNIKKKFSLKKVVFINDFCALAYSIDSLSWSQLKVINKGKKNDDNNTKIIIGAGTGLGKATIIYDENCCEFLVKNSEGGHNDFATFNREEFSLLEFIKEKYNKERVEEEDIVSGRGIENIYEFLSSKKLSANEISKRKNIDKFARNTMKMFYKFYARCAKNYALDELAIGGVYLAGGIVVKNPNFSKRQFIDEFTKNETYSLMLKQIPIYVICDYEASLYGVINYIKKKNL
jgi:glucokinase